MKKDKILVIGACGQIGTELVAALRYQHGNDRVIAADKAAGADMVLDVLEHQALDAAVKENGVTQIYLLAAMLSANGEQNAEAAWKLNVKSLLSVLKIAREQKLDKVFWPSSIAVFGPGAPKYHCPQHTRIEPNTVYGISKRAGEYWCNYYFEKYGVDVRSIRFPGLISYTAPPGGGTTDYAVDIFHKALEKQRYTCFLTEDNCLPMLYMPDAIRAALQLMATPAEQLTIRTSYNIAGMSFAPCDLAAAIKTHIPEFKISYEPDYRNAIANSWPASIRDDQARKDWGWEPQYDLAGMAKDMLEQLRRIKTTSRPTAVAAPVNFPDFVG
ncbi:NAD-dependent epimerase/dehydratase family protein [Mucilaginibacter sp.]|uniref:NAD-dependent epimerase/dehydratase family protein n=1 Tax=Mucilaginibacter sp. TaxID=1882438 RepID=UPI00284DBE9B|nr:NAD-dependent epimerase/dehydratase family protein [Mucilaginibacter sp.]MDR3695396.1 NAD-dependent epimerase/dehydratase family protein [Mucilaginibacter sp.]